MLLRVTNHRQLVSLVSRVGGKSFINCSFSTHHRSQDVPLRVAVIGSGPAGFYTAYRIMGKVPQAKIDMYEALPVPFGLVRYGVAPDHPEVKNCQDKFEEIASSPNFTFIGNVSIDQPGHTSNHCVVPLGSLMHHYDSIIFAYGASEDKRLGISGESTLSGIYSARQFVGWYNGLPDCANLDPELDIGEEAVIVGQGNVALDVARILLEHIDVLRKTDITERALEALAKSRIKRVHVVGRRGPMQAAFTIKEVRELMKLSNVAFYPISQSLIPEDIKSLPRVSKRIMEVISKGTPNVEPTRSSKSWSLDNCLSPRHFLAHPHDSTRVSSTEFDVTRLIDPFDPSSKVTNTGETTVFPSDLVFRSVGYKSTPLPGFADVGVQFDTKTGTVENDGLGRVIRHISGEGASTSAASEQVPGLYCAGWLKTGPTGVIATTMQNAFITADAIVHDWISGKRFLDPETAAGWDGVREEIGIQPHMAVTWDQWRKIDKAEKRHGRQRGKEREKFTSISDMLNVLG